MHDEDAIWAAFQTAQDARESDALALLDATLPPVDNRQVERLTWSMRGPSPATYATAKRQRDVRSLAARETDRDHVRGSK